MCEINLIKSKALFPIVSELLKSNKTVIITVTGTSMLPFLREGIDRVELNYCTIVEINKLDIVLIKRSTGEYILHRVTKLNKDHIYINGDAQCWREGPIYGDQVLARVINIYRKDKKLQVSNKYWKFLSFLWVNLYPIRSIFIKLLTGFKKLLKIGGIKWRQIL